MQRPQKLRWWCHRYPTKELPDEDRWLPVPTFTRASVILKSWVVQLSPRLRSWIWFIGGEPLANCPMTNWTVGLVSVSVKLPPRTTAQGSPSLILKQGSREE